MLAQYTINNNDLYHCLFHIHIIRYHTSTHGCGNYVILQMSDIPRNSIYIDVHKMQLSMVLPDIDN